MRIESTTSLAPILLTQAADKGRLKIKQLQTPRSQQNELLDNLRPVNDVACDNHKEKLTGKSKVYKQVRV